MKVSLQNTTKVVELVVDGKCVPARLWHGETESGIPVHAYVIMIVPEIPKNDPDIDLLTSEFEDELTRRADPRATVEAIPLRQII